MKKFFLISLITLIGLFIMGCAGTLRLESGTYPDRSFLPTLFGSRENTAQMKEAREYREKIRIEREEEKNEMIALYALSVQTTDICQKLAQSRVAERLAGAKYNKEKFEKEFLKNKCSLPTISIKKSRRFRDGIVIPVIEQEFRNRGFIVGTNGTGTDFVAEVMTDRESNVAYVTVTLLSQIGKSQLDKAGMGRASYERRGYRQDAFIAAAKMAVAQIFKK